MPTYIMDPFWLSTDRPIDQRYIPNNGSYNDVSAYWYPGMQVYQEGDQGIWYADNSLNWTRIGTENDASISNIYDLINSLDSSIVNINNQLITIDASLLEIKTILSIHDSSIGSLEIRVSSLESSFGYIDSSINQLFGWQISQDASILSLINDIIGLDASITGINSYQSIQDGSILSLAIDISSLDASIQYINNQLVVINSSINDINSYQTIQDSSIFSNLIEINQLDSSISRIDSSIDSILSSIESTDSSIEIINSYQIIQDNSIFYIESSLGNYVRKDGDIMTGPLSITNGGLQVGTTGLPVDVSIYSNLYVHKNTVIGGNLSIDGSAYITNIDISTGFIYLNTGLTGIPPSSMQSGIAIGRGNLEPYVFIFDESTKSFRIGIAQETSTG